MENKRLAVYVKIDEYKEVVDIINLIKNKINEAKVVLNRIYDIKRQEDKELDEIRGRALIGKCLLECSSGETDLENDLWKSMCNKKYNQGEDVIREFIRTC